MTYLVSDLNLFVLQTGFCGLFGETVDAMDYYTERIEALKEQVFSSALIMMVLT